MSSAFRFLDGDAPTTVSEETTEEHRSFTTTVSNDDCDADLECDEEEEDDEDDDGIEGESSMGRRVSLEAKMVVGTEIA
jgi:hypothetical protein